MKSASIRMVLGAAALLGMASAASAAQVVVDVTGNSNPYLAGQPDGTSCCGDSTANAYPTLGLTGFAEGSVITFSAVGGFNYSGGAPAASADGDSGPADMIASALGISGPTGINWNGLVGVFLGDDVNHGAAPAQRNDGLSFASISPELYQIFWIGDGLTGTGSGSVQQFVAPVGATRLFLGSTDGSGWWNNSGISTVTITYTPSGQTPPVPEPATWALMIAGFGLAGFAMRRRPAGQAAIA